MISCTYVEVWSCPCTGMMGAAGGVGEVEGVVVGAEAGVKGALVPLRMCTRL